MNAKRRMRRRRRTAPLRRAGGPAAERPARSEPSKPTFLPLAIGISGGVVLATVAFWFFKQQAEDVVQEKTDRYDGALLELASSARSRRMDQIMRAATSLGSHTAISTAAGLTALAMTRRHRSHDAWTVLISTGGAMVLNTTLKAIFQRQRPRELNRLIKLPKSHSFPSGHSLLCAATYPIVTHHLVESMPPRVQVLAMSFTGLVVLAVGYSRVYFAVHFPSDVLAGFAAGLGWLGLTSLSHTVMDRDLTARERRRLRSSAAEDASASPAV
ncbi:MAG TPA: phosphatase PAP2 family protein [Thermoanaerobaculia bacterium]|nr:phosphatase PAP2 family protein [Thermoanaerobaculia bacterium]